MGTARFLTAAALAMCLLEAQSKLGDNSAGSRGQPAHIIPLRDPEGDTIQPGDRRALPFSVMQTCGGECHDVALISHGWHFNAMASLVNGAGVPTGRNGQPWILVDRQTATQIPLSYRAWPGTYRPHEVGMSEREFAIHFGGRTAGGFGPEEQASEADRARWLVSGNLEVNCLVCHDASPAYDQAEYANQVAKENFRYAPAAASGLGLVTGSSKQMPDLFDYLLPNSVEDSLQPQIPKVEYAPANFLPSGKVAFDIVRTPKSSQCYYCHTNTDVEFTGAARFQGHEDIHLARGIGCNDCHRHGLDHMVTRGYEPGALSCEGCHAEGNAMGAPHPAHEGIPPVHFARITCTGCHSGPLPEQTTRQFKNGMTHGLGEFNVNKAPDAPPHLYYPVFARNEQGKLAPNRMVWPAFWGRLQNGTVKPIHPDQVKKALARAKLAAPPTVDEHWVEAVLRVLDEDGPSVYIAGGKLHRLEGGALRFEDSAQAQPYLWPIAHDVRPATQALGARGCQDCHSTDAALFFGKVAVDSPLASDRATPWTMSRFEKNLDADYQARLARTWRYRGTLKVIGLAAAAVLLLILLAYAVRGLERLSAATVGRFR
jgi:mono/diheme cytochrome c family protein